MVVNLNLMLLKFRLQMKLMVNYDLQMKLKERNMISNKYSKL